ncbi:MAG: TauD/TfdA family dioxygenase [Alphaproteobacteria bacterium]|nr:TauD/TfdA family dioxygenase [Alphaproteobacteria bacterium]
MQLSANRVIGAEITRLDVHALDDDAFASLDQALLRHQMLAIREQRLTPDQFIAFARRFGPIDLHVLDRYWMPGHPEIYVISNIVEGGRPLGNPREGFGWHTDLNYFANPTAVTLLYAIEVPPEGGETLFADTARSFAALPASRQAELRGLRACHSYRMLHESRPWLPPMTPEQIARTPDIHHPVVRRHPRCAREGLYLCDWSNTRLELADETEARRLQEELLAHMVRGEFVEAHRWRAGDLVLWDNRTLIHTATEYDRERHRRLVWRTSVRGEVPIAAH